MAHGMYKIKVLALSTNDVLYEYAAPTHPQMGEGLIIEGRRKVTSSISHILNSEPDGDGTYHRLAYVRIVVAV